MERIEILKLYAMKYQRFKLFILSLVILLPVRTSAIDIPKDFPTIEALIALHKAITVSYTHLTLPTIA